MTAPDNLGHTRQNTNELLRQIRRLRSDLDRTLSRSRSLQTPARTDAECASVEPSEPDFPPDPPTELVSQRK